MHKRAVCQLSQQVASVSQAPHLTVFWRWLAFRAHSAFDGREASAPVPGSKAGLAPSPVS